MPGGDSSVLAPGASGSHFARSRRARHRVLAVGARRTAPPCVRQGRASAEARPRGHRRRRTRGENVGQVLVRWALQTRPTCSVLPKSADPARIRSNLDVLDWDLDDDAARTLGSLATQRRMVDGSFWLSPAGPYRRSTTCGTTKKRREDVGDVVFILVGYHNHAASRIFLRTKAAPRQPNTPGSTPTTSYPSSLYSRTTPVFS